jgi:Amt family ammonium transporter
MTAQIIATVIAWVYAAVLTYILLMVIKAVVGLRPTADQEVMGLDLTQHGEEGYILF